MGVYSAEMGIESVCSAFGNDFVNSILQTDGSDDEIVNYGMNIVTDPIPGS
jgi:hypothetical protein